MDLDLSQWAIICDDFSSNWINITSSFNDYNLIQAKTIARGEMVVLVLPRFA